MELVKTIQAALDASRSKLFFILQGMTVLAVITTITLMIHVGPLSLLLFMTAGQGLILLSVVLCLILLVTQKKNIQREHYGPGQVIFRKGDTGDRLYVIIQGEVEVVDEEPGKGERIIAKLGTGDCFGEMALVNDEPRMATVRSRTGVNLMSLDREGFVALFAHLPPLRRFFEQMVEERAKSPKQRS